jgi:hypothetical protein
MSSLSAVPIEQEGIMKDLSSKNPGNARIRIRGFDDGSFGSSAQLAVGIDDDDEVATVSVSKSWNDPGRFETSVNMAAIGSHSPRLAGARSSAYATAARLAASIQADLDAGATLRYAVQGAAVRTGLSMEGSVSLVTESGA